MEWQAYEGLGAVNYCQGDYQAAVDNYLKALQTIKPLELGSDRIKKKIYRATAQLYAGKPDSGRPPVLDRHLRYLHIDKHPVLNEKEHPVLFEEHAHVGVTRRERYKAEIFVSEPPMMAKVDDHHLTNQPLQRHQKQETTDVSLHRYQELLKKKEEMNNIEEDSEESLDLTFTDSSDDGSETTQEEIQAQRKPKEVITAECHRDHEMSHGSNTKPLPLPARGSAKEDKKDGSSSKTYHVIYERK
ncbi:hypothetical protein ACF0H5_012998 [Mactra antiquata]